MTEPALTRDEIDCLKALSATCGYRLDGCPRSVLERLQALGLVVRAPTIWLPIPIRGTRYRLTAAGEVALRRSVGG